MRCQTLISILVTVLFCCTLCCTEFDKSELADKLNGLVQRAGWSLMGDVKVIIDHTIREIAEPMPEILEAVWSDRKPVNESNVLQRYKEIWTVLMCKYAEVALKYRTLITHLIKVCHIEKNSRLQSDTWFQRYYQCFRSLLTKLHGTAHSFKCMSDTLEFFYSLVSHSKPKPGIMLATKKLADFTSTVGPTTLSRLIENGNNANAVDVEMHSINRFITAVFRNNVYGFTGRYCIVPALSGTPVLYLISDFQQKKVDQLIPEDTTLLKYVLDEIDDCVAEILSKWFVDLGFAFDLDGKVTFRENSINNTVTTTTTTEIPPNHGRVDTPTYYHNNM